jgi:hypothetical protein
VTDDKTKQAVIIDPANPIEYARMKMGVYQTRVVANVYPESCRISKKPKTAASS